MRTIFLLDIDCFFASVEMALHPELRGRPLVVGGKRDDRGIVACPNYEARAYGVRTAMPLRTAARLLPPDAAFVRGSHALYGEYSERVMTLLEGFTPDVEQVSVDEAYMDVTGCLHLWGGDPLRMAAAMKERIMRECGLGVSIGIASTRVCAKIAAGLKKPDGLVLVPPGAEREFLAPLPVEVVPGVGPKTLPRLHARGIVTVGDALARRGGEDSWIGRHLRVVAQGKDDAVVHADRVEKSISRDTTFPEDLNESSLVCSTLYYLAERVCKTLRRRGEAAGTVTVKLRYTDFVTVQRQATLALPSANEEELFGTARRLLLPLLADPRRVRLVGVKASRIAAADAQLALPVTGMERRALLHSRLDALQEKHGYAAVQWGITSVLRERFRADDDGYHLHSPVYEL